MNQKQIQQAYRKVRSRMDKEGPSYHEPLKDLLPIALAHPESICGFFEELIEERTCSNSQVGALLSLMPMDNWSRLAPHAIAALIPETNDENVKGQGVNRTNLPPDGKWRLSDLEKMFRNKRGQNANADLVITHCSAQCPTVLHQFLRLLYVYSSFAVCSFGQTPFIDAPCESIEFLWSVLNKKTATDRQLFYAWNALIQTRDTQVILEAMRYSKRIDFGYELRCFDFGSNLKITANHSLSNVGLEYSRGKFKRLCSETPWHVLFPSNATRRDSAGDKQFHPTWHAPTNAPSLTATFGGEGIGNCTLCKRKLTHLISSKSDKSIDPTSDDGPNVLALCLACEAKNAGNLFYRYSKKSVVVFHSKGYDWIPNAEAKQLVFEETRIKLVDLGPRWKCAPRFPDYYQNFFRVGGEPNWVQGPNYPKCPDCGKTMNFYMQFITEFRLKHKQHWAFDGACYVFWCSRCQVSHLENQFT